MPATVTGHGAPGWQDARMLRVATWNVYLGTDLLRLLAARSAGELATLARSVRAQVEATDTDARMRAVAAVLAREQPDIVGLQEVSLWTDDGAPVVDAQARLLEALATAGVDYQVAVGGTAFGGAVPVGETWLELAGHNLLLVRRDGRFRPAGTEVGCYRTTLELATGIDGVGFPVRRGWVLARGTVDGRPVVVVDTHTEAWDAGVRDAQRDELLAVLGRESAPVVLLGDLNAQPAALGVPPPYVDAWQVAGAPGDPGFTCGREPTLADPAAGLHERIDYVLARGLTVLGCRVAGDRPQDRTPAGLWPSDHAAVVADLELPGPG
jgi:endonuclease/exonuclease/phosphatase family metal-dependent hydrolase